MKLRMKYMFPLLSIFILFFIAPVSSFAQIPLSSTQTAPAGTVDILWQTSGYVPPFYKGKAVRSHQNKILFVAIPHIIQNKVEIPTKNLIYKWEKDSIVWGEVSGQGKYTFEYDGSGLSQTFELNVTVSNSNGDVLATGNVTIEPTTPEVIMYENDPLHGILFQKALSGTQALKNEEVSVSSFPFFFNVSKRDDPKLTYAWQMNGNALTDSKAPDITLRKEKDSTGTSALGVTIQNMKEFIQSGQNTFTLSI